MRGRGENGETEIRGQKTSVFALRATPRQGGRRSEDRDYLVGAAFSRDLDYGFYDLQFTAYR